MIGHLSDPERFGPWRHDIDATERQARWRGWVALGIVFTGPESAFTAAARRAETDPSAEEDAWRELLALAPLPRRRLLSVWAVLANHTAPSHG